MCNVNLQHCAYEAHACATRLIRCLQGSHDEPAQSIAEWSYFNSPRLFIGVWPSERQTLPFTAWQLKSTPISHFGTYGGSEGLCLSACGNAWKGTLGAGGLSAASCGRRVPFRMGFAHLWLMKGSPQEIPTSSPNSTWKNNQRWLLEGTKSRRGIEKFDCGGGEFIFAPWTLSLNHVSKWGSNAVQCVALCNWVLNLCGFECVCKVMCSLDGVVFFDVIVVHWRGGTLEIQVCPRHHLLDCFMAFLLRGGGALESGICPWYPFFDGENT